MEYLTLILNPKVLAVFGPAGAILLGVCVMLYKFYREERKRAIEAEEKNDKLHEQRLEEALQMSKDYHDLAANLDSTLDAVVKAMRPKHGNGNGS